LVKGRNSIIISGIILAFIAGTFVSGTQVFGAAQSGWQAAVTELQQELDDLFGDISDLEDDIDAEIIDRIDGDADVLLQAQNDITVHAADVSAHHGRYTDAEAVTAVGPHTVNTDTQLSEAQVEGFITNGAIDLDAGTTLGGAAISTGPHNISTQVIKNSITLSPGATGGVNAVCPAGTTLTGGGFSASALDLNIAVSQPSPETGQPTLWSVVGKHPGGAGTVAQTLFVFAVCTT